MQIHLFRALMLTIAVCVATNTQAQEWPAKSVRIINPATAGGVSDVMARAVAQHFTATFGQNFVVDNRAGANGIIGLDIAAKSPPDGYTLLAATSGMLVMNSAIFQKLPFNVMRDFAPISIVISAPFAVFVHPSLPVKTAKELIALAKARPGQLPYGSFGPASFAHMAMELFMLQTGTKMTHVPYKGGAPMASALVAGEVTVAFDSVQNQLPFLRANRVRAIAMASPKRVRLLPEIPTLAESGVQGAELPAWYGMLAPAGTPRAIINRLYDDMVAQFKSSELRERFAALGSEVVLNLPDQFTVQLKNEIDAMTKVAREAGVKAN
ncbi:MAG: tripartite tricarboxylate transporter substrate binding protein [Burkholderiales bacterium]